MTPAEMREMAAKVADFYGSIFEHLPETTAALRESNETGRTAAAGIATTIRAIPIPDTTAADDLLDTAREAMEYAIKVFTPPDNQIQVEVATRCRKALAAIDAAKAKGGG